MYIMTATVTTFNVFWKEAVFIIWYSAVSECTGMNLFLSKTRSQIKYHDICMDSQGGWKECYGGVSQWATCTALITVIELL